MTDSNWIESFISDQTVTTTSSMLDGSSVVRETVTRPGQAAETVTYLVGANRH
ncbi:MAG: hypothetical protein AAGU11_22600 [Syntrophobacteraceae bacterium]